MEDDKYNEVFNEFFKLKHIYEEKINKTKNVIIKNPNLTIQEKREKFKSLKLKCVNCGKEGGTNFSFNGNIIEARCNSSSPCNFHIKLQRAKYELLTNYNNSLQNEIIEKKHEIILNKLNFLYGYENEKNTLVKFNEIKSNFMKILKDFEFINEKYIEIVNNSVKDKMIQDKKTQLFIMIEDFKKYIKQYQEENDNSFLKEATELYINYIKPIEIELMNIKYPLNQIIKEDINKEESIYKLDQQRYTIKQLNYPILGQTNKILIYKK